VLSYSDPPLSLAVGNTVVASNLPSAPVPSPIPSPSATLQPGLGAGYAVSGVTAGNDIQCGRPDRAERVYRSESSAAAGDRHARKFQDELAQPSENKWALFVQGSGVNGFVFRA